MTALHGMHATGAGLLKTRQALRLKPDPNLQLPRMAAGIRTELTLVAHVHAGIGRELRLQP